MPYPFGERLGDSRAETYRVARAGLRHFRSDRDWPDEWTGSSRDHKTTLEFMSCARGNLWRAVAAASPEEK